MGTVDDIKTLQQEGRSDSEIIDYLRNRGISQKEILDAFAQARIKTAVEAPAQTSPIQGLSPAAPMPPAAREEFQGMQPSMMAPEHEEAPAPQPVYQPEPQAQYPAYQGYPAEAYPSEAGYQQTTAYAAPQLSSDTITEISEQVVMEKLSPLKTQLEKILDMKTTLDTRIDSLSERLQRIEKIIDRLQLSLLQKVGEYVTNVDDIKKELIETQKSFKALLPETSAVKKKSPAYT